MGNVSFLSKRVSLDLAWYVKYVLDPLENAKKLIHASPEALFFILNVKNLV